MSSYRPASPRQIVGVRAAFIGFPATLESSHNACRYRASGMEKGHPRLL
ncbi:hypothetical protein EDP1_2745 [Pseudomonas putida S610]|nr:hypothetical protein EDP1_2745 [Pseudomonas putida S610]